VLTVPGKRVIVRQDAPLYAPWAPPKTENTRITLIPYFAWNNRGMGEMRVWLPIGGNSESNEREEGL
ncbi:MAG: hypothetical protein IKP72_10525, partial [Clostridia bacterium]|nr:hypothetical protein [Clostridia bacterium]